MAKVQRLKNQSYGESKWTKRINRIAKIQRLKGQFYGKSTWIERSNTCTCTHMI